MKDKLNQSGLSLSGGQQQRLCIARALAVEPEVILMDEPASALDPISTLKIEELMQELKKDYTIVIVTHNMQQAARVSDYTAMMMIDEHRAGHLIEFDQTNAHLHPPEGQAHRRLCHRAVSDDLLCDNRNMVIMANRRQEAGDDRCEKLSKLKFSN